MFRSAPGPAGGYSFEAVVPWEAFPPFESLRLEMFQIMVDVFNGRHYSSMSAEPKHGDPSSFNAIAFEAGRQFRITPCGYPLEGRNELRESDPALFFPQRDDNVVPVFRLRNFDTRYSYYPSPIAETTNFFKNPMEGNTVICGPRFAIARKGAVQRFAADAVPVTLDVKMEPEG